MDLNDEVIAGHLVTAEKKKLIATYQDLLVEFDRLCQQNGITYWVFFGTLLGAVRHQGFIPWDDDVDIMMPRESFDRLWNMTNEQFGAKEPYFLQNPVTDPTYVQLLLRFRRSDTTAFKQIDATFLRERKDLKPYNMGINLSIFPLDYCGKSELMRQVRKKLAYLFLGIDYRANRPAKEKPLFHKICRAGQVLIGREHLRDIIHACYRSKDAAGPMVHCLDGLYPNPHYWHAEDFRETVMLPYQDILVRAPIGYDRLLTDRYGDYMQFPPPEQRVEKHDCYLDTETPYAVSAQKLLNGEIDLPGRNGASDL